MREWNRSGDLKGHSVRLWLALLVFHLAVFVGGTAGRADVLEIDDQGSVHVRNGGGEVQWIDRDAQPETASDDPDDSGVPDAALTLVAAPRVPEAWRASLVGAADRYQVSPELLSALVWQESRWHPAAVSPKGAVGLAQLMPATARAMAIDAHDPAANLDGGARYLRRMLDLFDGNVERALAAYNAGPGRVLRSGGLPAIAETRAYVSTIFDRLTPNFDTGFSK